MIYRAGRFPPDKGKSQICSTRNSYLFGFLVLRYSYHTDWVCDHAQSSANAEARPGLLQQHAQPLRPGAAEQPGGQAARRPGGQAARQPGSQAARRPGSQPEGQKARRPEDQRARRPEGQKARRPEGQKARRPGGPVPEARRSSDTLRRQSLPSAPLDDVCICAICKFNMMSTHSACVCVCTCVCVYACTRVRVYAYTHGQPLRAASSSTSRRSSADQELLRPSNKQEN